MKRFADEMMMEGLMPSINTKRLTQDEIYDPCLVFEALFKQYSLVELKKFLRMWLMESISSRDIVELSDVVWLYEQVEKLMEAAWIIHDKQMPITEGHGKLVRMPEKDNQYKNQTS